MPLSLIHIYIERGKLNVRDSLIKRIENVRRTGLADEIIIEEYQGQTVSYTHLDVYKRQLWKLRRRLLCENRADRCV